MAKKKTMNAIKNAGKIVVKTSQPAKTSKKTGSSNKKAGSILSNKEALQKSQVPSVKTNVKKQKQDALKEYKRFQKDYTATHTKKAKVERINNVVNKGKEEVGLAVDVTAMTRSGIGTKYYEDATSKVSMALDHNYVSPEEMEAWYKANTYEVSTGFHQKERKLKFNAVAPPCYDKNGNKVDISKEWDYYRKVEKRADDVAKSQANKASLYANHADESMGTYNSNLDAFIGLITGHGLEGYKRFYGQYIIKPLKAGNFSALGLNILNDLGETLDFIPRGVKSIASSQTMVYGRDTFWTNEEGTSFTNQKYWVYSGGEETQKKLMDLGAMDVINGNRYTANDRVAAIQKIKKAGLWDEFLKFQDEYNADYDRGSFETTLNALKDAYTTHKNYDADTGNIISDLALELITDPTLIASAGKSVASTGIRKLSDEALTTAFKIAGKPIDALDKPVQKQLNYWTRTLGEDLLSKGDKAIDETAFSISKTLLDNKVMTIDEAKMFREELVKQATAKQREQAFTIVKSLHYADKAMDAVDRTLLKNVFAVPYVAGKTIVPLAKRGITEVGTLKHSVAVKQFLTKFGKQDPETEGVSIFDARELEEALKTEPLTDQDPGFADEMYELVRHDTAERCNKLDDIISQSYESAEELEQAVNEYLITISKGEVSSFEEFVDYTQRLNEFGVHDDTVDLVEKQFEKYKAFKEVFDKKLPYKEKAVSGKEVPPPIVAEDKLIDNSKRLSGELHKGWSDIVRTHGEFLKKHTQYAEGLKITRGQAPTIKEAEFSFLNMLQELSWLKAIDTEGTEGLDEALAAVTKFYNDLLRIEFEIDFHDGLQYNRFQADKYATFEKALDNKYFGKVLSSFTDPNTACYKFVQKFLKSKNPMLPEWSQNVVQQLVHELKHVEAFKAMKRKLDLAEGPLTDDVKWRVLDVLFNRDWVDPHRLTDMTGKEMNTFIEKVSVGLAALSGTKSLALDSFRNEASDFSGEIWSKYADELSDLNIQARLNAILAGGHEDPMSDVNVQILQYILRDPDAIAFLNKEAKKQDIFFYDIETTGLNDSTDKITAIACKKWEPISDEATLDEILTLLEKEGQSYQQYMPEAWIRENILDDTLKVNYKNRPEIPKTREAMLDEYIKRYGAEANGKTVTEEDIFQAFMKDMDNSYLARNSQSPMLISHNNNGFDGTFMKNRMSNKEAMPSGEVVAPSHMKDLYQLFSKEANTYTTLRRLFPASELSKEQADYIRRLISDYAKDVSKFSTSMRVFQPGNFVKCLDNFRIMEITAGTDPIVNAAKDEVGKIFNETKEAHEEFIKDVASDKTTFGINPFSRNVESLSDTQLKDLLGEDGFRALEEAIAENNTAVIAEFNKKIPEEWRAQKYDRTVDGMDNMMRMSKDNSPLDNIPRFGSRVVKADTVSNYFIVPPRIAQTVLMKMDSFARARSVDLSKRLKSTGLLQGHMDEFNKVIAYVKSFAEDLGVYDDLYYIKYLKEPETVVEAYVVAQKVWDMFKTTTHHAEAMKYIKEGTPFEKVPESVRGSVVALTKFKKTFDIDSVVTDEVRALLDDEDGLFHYQIFKDVAPSDNLLHLNQLKNSEHAQRSLLHHCAEMTNKFKAMAIATVGNATTKAKDLMIVNVLNKSYDAIKHYVDMADEAKDVFIKESRKALAKMMDIQTYQVLDFVTKSEEHLMRHLLFHNQVMVVPKMGNKVHTAQMQKLLKMLRENKEVSELIHYTEDIHGYVWIGIKKEWQDKIEIVNDAAHSTAEATITLHGTKLTYNKPPYKRIRMEEASLSDKTMFEYFKSTEESVLRMSRGASAGSLGITHTMSKQRHLYANAPEEFKSNTLDLEFTCNERFWHNANYDMTLLGGMEYRWKVGNQNDVDYLLSSRQALEETARKTQAERLFVDGIFGAKEQLGLDVVYKGFSDKEIRQAFKESDGEMVCLVLKESGSTESGFFVEAVDMTTNYGVKNARKQNAIIVPYSMYSTLAEALNKSKATNKFLKLYSQLVHLYKLGYFLSPGMLLRNFIDGTMKAMNETGDTIGLFQSYLEAGKLLMKYKKISRALSEQRSVCHNVMVDLERNWDSFNFDMSFDQFKMLDDYMQRSEAGGKSHVLKLVEAHRNEGVGVDKLAREANDGRDLVDNSLLKFELLSEDDAVKLFENAKLSQDTDMTAEEFADIFSKRVTPDEARRLEYEGIAKVLMEDQVTYKRELGMTRQRINDAMLSPMSNIEEMIRLGMFLTLEKQGFSESQILSKITKTQFDYNLKSPATKRLEMVIPFYTFMHDNMIYWCKMVSESPRMLHYIENIWGELSWDSSEYSYEELVENASLQYAMLSGNIPLGKQGFMFKANPSFMDAFKMSYSPLERIYSGLFTPIQNLLQEVVRGSDIRNIFGEQSFWSDVVGPVESFYDFAKTGEGPKLRQFVETLPVVGTLLNRYFVMGPRAVDRLPEGYDYRKYLLCKYPDVFGVIGGLDDRKKSYPTDDRDWDEIEAYMNKRGKFWDDNQKKFVTMENFIFGGLNRDFDFSKEGEWDEFCRLRRLYLGEVWDANIDKFVPIAEQTKGGLNREDLSWEEVLYYNARKGKFYNSETHKFVDMDELSFDEQRAVRLMLLGEEWVESKKAWVQVKKPMEGFGEILLETDPAESGVSDWFVRMGIIIESYAADPGTVRRIASEFKEATPEELNIFLSAMDKIGLGGYENTSSGTSQNKTPAYRTYQNKATNKGYIQTSRPYSYARNAYQGVRAGGKVYSKPYTYSNNQAGLKMATSDDPAYYEYYNYDYMYQYKFRNPTRGVADFPQTKLGIQRYMRMRTDALTRKMRLRAEYNIDNINSYVKVSPQTRLQAIKLHWWMR